MSTVDRLSKLQKHSGKRVPSSIIHGFSAARGTLTLINIKRISGDWVGVPAKGSASILSNLQSRNKVMTFAGGNAAFMKNLNKQLMGGDSYPILEAVLGTAVGVVSGGAGLLFAATSLGVNLARRTSDVLVRAGDEIWHIEEIGKIFEDNIIYSDRWVPTHVSSYLIVDPYRSRGGAPEKGWLIHEERKEVIL